MPRNVALIKDNQAHAKHFQIRFKNFRKYTFVHVKQIGKRRQRHEVRVKIGNAVRPFHSFFLRIISCTSLSNVANEYSSLTFGRHTILYVPFILFTFRRNASHQPFNTVSLHAFSVFFSHGNGKIIFFRRQIQKRKTPRKRARTAFEKVLHFGLFFQSFIFHFQPRNLAYPPFICLNFPCL